MVRNAIRTAIVGAGIGGLAAALALSRKDLAVDLYEQVPEPGEVGAGLHLGSNGSRLLHRLGLAGELERVAVRPVALEVRDWSDGQVRMRQPMGASWEASFGAPYYTVHRADLHRMLLDRLPPGTLRPGHRLTGFTAGDDVVRLRFAERPAAEADVLVGADGVHSVVRAALHGPGTPVLTDTVAMRGVLPADAVPGVRTDALLVWSGPDARLLCAPVRAGREIAYVAVLPATGQDRESWSAVGQPADLRAAFADWCPDVRALAEAVDSTHRWTLQDREPLPQWGTGRVTLLGDAAHPMLPHHGQGANQAVEDGVALAHCLARVVSGPDSVTSALRHYESLRRPHTTRVQLGARDGGSGRFAAPGNGGGVRAVVEDVSWTQRYDVEAELDRV